MPNLTETPIQDCLAAIVSEFSWNANDVARIFGTNRATALAWGRGELVPPSETAEKIVRLAWVANWLQSTLPARTGRWVETPILNGRSLVQIVLAGDDPTVAMELLRIEAIESAKRRTSTGGRND